MNVHSRRPDRSPEAIEKRRKAAEQARAANIRQGYVHDSFLEEATARYVAGEITREEYRQLMIEASDTSRSTFKNRRPPAESWLRHG